ncbi:MAG TPA: energy transducer TonB [Steroidobacteraceae bacterium]|nr:energy transducer TonB [Steroidobacteraceae bacterium]
MFATARAVFSIALFALPVTAFAQAGPSDPQVINAASTAKINIGQRKLGGQLVATVQVDDSGKVGGVTVLENTTDEGFEPQLVKVLQNTRYRPAIDESGKPVAAAVDMKVELRPSTGSVPKPAAAKPDPQLTEKEKARIRKMKCADFRWEWELIRKEADDAAATEFMPRIATAMYAAYRTEQGEYVDAKVWKASAKALQDAARRCADAADQLFWQDTFRVVLDEAVPK